MMETIPVPVYWSDGTYAIVADMTAALQPKAPAVPLYDGLTAVLCLARYTYLQRHDGGVPLTEAQKMAAQDLWRKELAAKTKAAEIKERDRVVVDREFEEWE